MGYQYLTIEQRSQIYALKSNNHSQRDIAAHIKVDKSTVHLELKRNAGNRGYGYQQAHEIAMIRRSSATTTPKKWTQELERRVEDGLKEQHSPEQLSGRLKLITIHISHERIYQPIHDDKVAGGTLSKVVEQKSRLGDWEEP